MMTIMCDTIPIYESSDAHWPPKVDIRLPTYSDCRHTPIYSDIQLPTSDEPKSLVEDVMKLCHQYPHLLTKGEPDPRLIYCALANTIWRRINTVDPHQHRPVVYSFDEEDAAVAVSEAFCIHYNDVYLCGPPNSMTEMFKPIMHRLGLE